MKEYHKIKTLWEREPTKPCNMIIGKYALPEFEMLKDLDWIATEKVDGTNVRVMWDGNKITFNGKTDNAQMPVVLMQKLEELFGGEANEQVFEQTFDCGDVCLYGEGYGGKIQKAGETYGKEQRFVLFDIKIGDWWLLRKDVEDIASKLGIEVIPIIASGTLNWLSNLVAKGIKSQWGDFKAEGIVARPPVELFNRRGERIITKLKHKDYENNKI